MINLIDNTTLHHLGGKLKREKPLKRIYISELFEVLNFAEHIMFSDKIRVSKYAIPDIQYKTEIAIDKFDNINLRLESNFREKLIDFEDYSEEKYQQVCEKAIPKIQNSLSKLKIRELIHLSKYTKVSRVIETSSKKSSVPDLNTEPIIRVKDYLTRDFEESELEENKLKALNGKAMGAYSYIISSNKSIYSRIREIGKTLDTNETKKVAKSIEVIFRLHINEKLSNITDNSFYSPAPGRSTFMSESNKIIKNKFFYKSLISNFLKKEIANTYSDYKNILVEYITKNPRVSIPVFAIYHLVTEYDRKNYSGSFDNLFESAMKLRYTNSSIQEMKNEINEYQKFLKSNNPNNQAKVKNQLNNIQYSIKNEISSPYEKAFDIIGANLPYILFGSLYNSELVVAMFGYKTVQELINFADCYYGNSSYLIEINNLFRFDSEIIDKFENMLGVEIIEN